MRALWPDWTGDEPCRSMDPEWYFPAEKVAYSSEQRQVCEICATCQMRPQCLEWGLHHERYGIWGGLNQYGLDRIRRERRIRVENISAHLFPRIVTEEAS